jgi:hypothetical protein
VEHEPVEGGPAGQIAHGLPGGRGPSPMSYGAPVVTSLSQWATSSPQVWRALPAVR